MSIEGRKLLYCPIESQVNQAFLNCKGFLELDSDTEVRVKYLTTPAFERFRFDCDFSLILCIKNHF